MSEAFWSSTALEPKRAFRWTIQFHNDAGGAGSELGVVWFAKKVSLPSITLGEVKHSFLDKTFYFPGRVEWNTVELTMVDPVSPDAVDITLNMFEDAGYHMMSKADDSHATISKANSVSKGLGTVFITAIDHEGVNLEQWELKNAWPKSVKFGEFSYDSDELREITLEMRYDWAKCTIYNGAIAGKPYFKAGTPDGGGLRKDST